MAANYHVTYDGAFPNFCCGNLTLYKNGIVLASGKDIPFNTAFRCYGANTYGEYIRNTWCGGEVYYTYVDGLKQKAWIRKNKAWLKSLAPKRDWPAIFRAFQASDMRPECCGGCI